MAHGHVNRKLAAIMAADVVGYSRLVGEAEEETVRRLGAYRAIIDERVAARHGRAFGAAGDSVIAEFASPVEAVRCAVEIQREIEGREAELPEDRRMRFRIGVNLGDVIVEGGDLLGDGVNLAARLEGLAEPGGVAISRPVLDQIEGKLDEGFVDAGEHRVKNIARPVHVWRWRAEHQPSESGDAAKGDGLALPDKPSIAVLPFDNMSGDSEQDYFSDGITEDIITALSRIRWFFVIARNSSFAFKGRSQDVRRVAADLGVRYVLEGSVRKAGARVRISAQLIEGASGGQVWAKRYDRELEDLFALQDELTETIVGAIEPALGKAERERAKTKRPDNLDAWDVYQRGMSALYKRTREDLAEAQRLFARALELDAGLVPALAGSVDASYYQLVLGYAGDQAASRARAMAAARRAVELDHEDAAAHCALGKAYLIERAHEAAIPALETALELNPSLAWAHYGLGAALAFSGRAEEAVPHLETAIRLSPHDPHMGSFLVRMADAHLFMGRHGEAEAWARKALRQPSFQWSRHAVLVAALGHLERGDEARRALDELLALRPDFSLDFVRETHLITDAVSLDHYLDGLRKAGLAA